MASSISGSFRFFRAAGVQVYVHWSWFIVAYISISTRSRAYTSMVWNVAEYLGLFLIVLLHEFGHVLACRQVGGVANEIVLWPLGGVALGRPPPRPGAELWTIAAGPLVNVVLWPVFFLAAVGFAASGMSEQMPDLARLLVTLGLLNTVLLVFNLLPIYPLDGGQILRSLLWFRMGRARSLQVAATIGLIGIALLAGYRVLTDPEDLIWTLVLAYFLGSQCLAGLRQARAQLTLERLPRRTEFRCPSCQASPPMAGIWGCPSCGQAFDPFLTQAVCPHCRNALEAVLCIECGTRHSYQRWAASARPQPRATGPYIDV